MKKFAVLTVALLFVFALTGRADNDRPITVDQLPATAQKFIKAHFPKTNVSLAKMDTDLFEKSYEVIFVTGDKLEFDSNGNWTEVDCKRSEVPAKLVPTQINTYVNANYSGNKILKIEKDRSEYEINLSNGVEIKFNKNFMVIDID